MTAYTLQVVPHAGAAVTLTAPATSGNTAPCGAGIGLLIKNGDGSSHTVTITVPAAITLDGLGIGNATPGSGGRALAVAAGATSVIPLVPSVYQDPATGLATFGLDAVTSVTCGVIAISA